MKLRLSLEDIDILNDWIDWGGIIWCELDVFSPSHVTRLYHTTDEGIIQDMYNARNKEYENLDINSYCKLLCKNALKTFNALDEYKKYLEW